MRNSLFTMLLMMIATGLNMEVACGQSSADSVIKLPVLVVTDTILKPSCFRNQIGKAEVAQSPVADVAGLLKKLPNVGGIRRGGYALDPVVRGFRYSQINVYLDDGIHVEGGCPNRMDPVLSHLVPEDIERIELVRGPYQLQYGPSHGASVRVITHEKATYKVGKPRIQSFSSFDANRMGYRTHLSVQGAGNRLYYKVSAGIKDFGDYTDGNGKTWSSAYSGKSISTALGIKISPYDELILTGRGSYGREVMFPALPMDEIADNTNIVAFRYARKYQHLPERHFSVSGYHSRVYHEMDNRFRPQYNQVVPPYTGLMRASAKVNTRVTGLRMDADGTLGDIKMNTGIDAQHSFKDGTRHTTMIMQMDDQQFLSEKFTNLWKSAYIFNAGAYARIASEKKSFGYTGTLRFDINHSSSSDTLIIQKEGTTWFGSGPETKVLWSMALMFNRKISDRFTTSLGLARSARPADMQEKYIKFLATGYDKYDYLGNPGLNPEISYQADLTFNYSAGNLKMYLNLFRSDVVDYIYGTLLPPSVARPVSMGAPGVKQFNNINRAVLTGFESGITAEPAGGFQVAFSSGITYAWFPEIEKVILADGQYEGKVMIKNDPVAEIPAFESMLRITRVISAIRLNTWIEIRAVAAQRRVAEASYELPSPGYVTADAGAEYKPLPFLSIIAGINNIANKAYYDHLNRKQAGTTGKLYEPGRTIYINLRITI